MHDKEEVNDDTVTVEDIVEKKRFFLRDNTIWSAFEIEINS